MVIDTGAKSTRPFTRSQAWDLQNLQDIFMKMEVCEGLLNHFKGFHMLKCEEEPLYFKAAPH